MQVPQVPQVPKVAWVPATPVPEMLARRLIGLRTRQGQTCTRVAPITGFAGTTIAELSVLTKDGVSVMVVWAFRMYSTPYRVPLFAKGVLSFGGGKRGRDSAACLGDVYFGRYFYLVLKTREYRTWYSVQLASRG
ncbi:hypothetical protein GGI42DRAFT_328675 [Trichoderma sp. SZMC 28013]